MTPPGKQVFSSLGDWKRNVPSRSLCLDLLVDSKVLKTLGWAESDLWACSLSYIRVCHWPWKVCGYPLHLLSPLCTEGKRAYQLWYQEVFRNACPCSLYKGTFDGLNSSLPHFLHTRSGQDNCGGYSLSGGWTLVCWVLAATATLMRKANQNTGLLTGDDESYPPSMHET